MKPTNRAAREALNRIQKGVADTTKLTAIPSTSIRDLHLVAIDDPASVWIYMHDSTSTVDPGRVEVPDDIAASAAYISDPTTAPGRWINLVSISAGVAGAGPANFAARAATTANLAATLSGNVLEANAGGALGSIDGVAVLVDDVVLVKNQSAPAANGIFVITSLGDGSNRYLLTRIAGFDSDADAVSGASVFVSEGTVAAGTTWDLTTANPITLGTTSLTFTKRPTLAELASTATGKGASLVGIEDSAGNTATTNVEAALAELYGFNKVKLQTFNVTLGAGTVTKNTGITVTANTRVVGIIPTARGGTFPAGGFESLSAGNTVGGAGTGAVTITARKADGTLENGCTDTLSVFLAN